MTRSKILAVVFVGLIVTSGTAAAALQYGVFDEYDTKSELDNAGTIVGMDIVGQDSSASVDSVATGGFTDGVDDGDLSEYASNSGFAAVDSGSGDYVLKTSPMESNSITRSNTTIGDYGTFSFADSVQDMSMEPWSVATDWSNKGTVGSNATVNANSNLELADSDTYTGASFTTSDDTSINSVDVTVGSVGATVSVQLQTYDGTSWSTVNSKSVSSTGTTTLSTSQAAGEYRVKLVAQGDSTTATVIESTTVHANDPAGSADIKYVNTAGTASDTTDDNGLKVVVKPSGNISVVRYDNAAGTSTSLMTHSVSDASVEHNYALERQADDDLALSVDGTQVASYDVTDKQVGSIDRMVIESGNGHSFDDLQAPAETQFAYYSDKFNNVSDAREGFARLDAQPGTQATVSVYAIDSNGTYHLVNETTVTVAEGESAISKTIAVDATNADYQDYEVDVDGHGDASIRSVGMTQATSSSGVVGDWESTTGTSSTAFYGVIAVLIGGLVALSMRS